MKKIQSKKTQTKSPIKKSSKKYVVRNDLILYLRKIGYPNLAKLITPENAEVKPERKIQPY